MERRKTERFGLNLPIAVHRVDAPSAAIHGITINVSASGVLFHAPLEFLAGGRMEYALTLPGGKWETTELHCKGTVMRVTPLPHSGGYEIAVSVERWEFARHSREEGPVGVVASLTGAMA